MAFKFVVFAAALACANAGLLGAPVAYSAAPAVSTAYLQQTAPVLAAAPVAYHSPAIGASHQSVVRSPLGNQAVSQYTKSVDTAFSSVRKFDTRITNDGFAVAHAPVATYAAHAPVVSTYAAHAPVVSSYAAHAPVVSAYAAHAPVVSSYASPVLRTAAVGYAPAAVGYSPAAVVSHATFSGLGASYAW